MQTAKTLIKVSICILLLCTACKPSKQDLTPYGFIPPGLTGDYLGQIAPGDSAVLFAPGIMSTGMATRDVAISRDGNEIYFRDSKFLQGSGGNLL